MIKKLFPYGVLTASAFARVIPHISNFSPFPSGITFGYPKTKSSLLTTIVMAVVLYLSDLCLHFITPEVYPVYGLWIVYVYPIHVMNGFISKCIINKPNYLQLVNIGVACTITSFNFFFLSNFGEFIFGHSEHSVEVLQQVYIEAIPFFPLELVSHLLFTYFFFIINYFLFKDSSNDKVSTPQEENLIHNIDYDNEARLN